MAGRSDIEKGKVDQSVEEWKSTFRAKLRRHSPLPASCCIFRVPEVLRIQKQEAYEPHMVSIGPFHRGRREQFQLVENVKGWYLECLLSRLNISLDSLIDRIKVLEKDARACYSEPFIHLDHNKFVEMLILDGCFLIELFRKALVMNEDIDEKDGDHDDPIFSLSCMLEYLYHDILLLENQLPWSVLEFFYDLIFENSRTNPLELSLSELIIKFFIQSVADGRIFSYPEPDNETVHILDFIRTALVLSKQQHTVTNRSRTRSSYLPARIPCAITLSELGVKFKRGAPGCIMDIEFMNGVFTIPPLVINLRSGPLFRNLIAYEQLYQRCSQKVTSYIVLMDSLLGSIEDVDLLCEERILSNMLSGDQDASQFFKQLCNHHTIFIMFDYMKLCVDVNVYCAKQRRRLKPQRNRWIKQLKHDYFGTPWKILSWFAAGTLLVLTLLQTIYTINN